MSIRSCLFPVHHPVLCLHKAGRLSKEGSRANRACFCCTSPSPRYKYKPCTSVAPYSTRQAAEEQNSPAGDECDESPRHHSSAPSTTRSRSQGARTKHPATISCRQHIIGTNFSEMVQDGTNLVRNIYSCRHCHVRQAIYELSKLQQFHYEALKRLAHTTQQTL